MSECRQVEHWYTVSAAGERLDLHPKTVIEKLKKGEFGTRVVDLNNGHGKPNYRIPASGINTFLSARRLFLDGTAMGITDIDAAVAARTEGELRRKEMRRAA